MFQVYAYNHFNTVKFEEYYLEWDYALMVFNTACKCVDCHEAMIIDATTGEVILCMSDLLKQYK